MELGLWLAFVGGLVNQTNMPSLRGSSASFSGLSAAVVEAVARDQLPQLLRRSM